MKTVFIIRGFAFNSTAADANFKSLRDMLSEHDYRVLPAPMMWNGQTLTSYVAKFVQFYELEKGTQNMLMGGSFGAMASFIAAPLVKPDHLVLCSLSAFFREDLSNYDKQYLINMFGSRRAEDLRTHSAPAIASQVMQAKVNTTMVYGEKEKVMYPHLVARVRDTAAALHTSPIELSGAGHKMREPEYVAGLKSVLTRRTEA